MKIKHVQVTLGSISVPEVAGNIEYFPMDETGQLRKTDRGLASAAALRPQAKQRIRSFAAAIQELIEPETFDFGQGPVEIVKTIHRIDPHTRDDPDKFSVVYRPTPTTNRGQDVHENFDASDLPSPLQLLWRNIMVDLRTLCWDHLQKTIYGEVTLPPELIKPTVFVSYKREYDDFVEPLCQQLAMRGLEVFKDNWGFKSGDRFHAEIDDYLARCHHFVAVISPGYKDSPECQREYVKAMERQGESQPPRRHAVYWKAEYRASDVPVGWEDIHGVKFGEDKIDFVEKVSELLEGIWEIDTHPFHS